MTPMEIFAVNCTNTSPDFIPDFTRFLFWEEIGAYAAAHTRYVLNACGRVGSIILLPSMVGTSFKLVPLKRLNKEQA